MVPMMPKMGAQDNLLCPLWQCLITASELAEHSGALNSLTAFYRLKQAIWMPACACSRQGCKALTVREYKDVINRA